MRGVPGLLARRRAPRQAAAGAVPAVPPAGPRVLGAPLVGGVAAAPAGERPYAGITADQQAAYQIALLARGPAARPAFDPAPGRAPETAPLPVLPANAMVPPPPPAAPRRPVPAESQEMLLLRRVRDGMERKWRAESFVADKKALPVFAALTREMGWQGLHMPPQSVGWQRWSTERWAARERALAAAGHAKALAELDEIHARYAAQALAAGDAA